MTQLENISTPRDAVLSILRNAENKLTPQALVKQIQACFNLTARQAKSVIKELVAESELCYQYHFGTTYVEISFLRPVPVTDHFTLSPPGFAVNQKNPEMHFIIIEQGISFGSGQHPTTQLCLNAIENCLIKQRMTDNISMMKCADIGTGSGVLAVALCKSGVQSCHAYEIDPVSVHEAKKNIRHNHLEDQIILVDGYMHEQKETFGIIAANLRFPTLKQLSPLIFNSLKPSGLVILSGVRSWEKDKMVRHYSTQGFELIAQKDLKNWSAFVFKKILC